MFLEIKARSGDSAITYFYFDFRDPVKRTYKGFYAAIIAQVMEQRSEIPPDVEAWRRSDQLPASSDVLLKVLGSLTEGLSKFIVIVDAVDECSDQFQIAGVLKKLLTLPNINLMVISREEMTIRDTFLGLPEVAVGENEVITDIKRFTRSAIETYPRLRRLKPTLKDGIVAALTQGSGGM